MALRRKHEQGETDFELDTVCSYTFSFNGGVFTAFFSGPVWQGGFEWELDSVQAKLREV